MSTLTNPARAPSEWEEIFAAWAQPPGQTEKDRCESTINQISQAIADHPNLSAKGVETFAQGSYANRVNVRKDSDVDVCCYYPGVFYYSIPDGYDKSHFGLGNPAQYTYDAYKNEVEEALVARFGRRSVVRGNKAFDVNERGYRVDADVVATFAYREYFINADGYSYHKGTALITDKDRKLVTNYPNQQYEKGVEKNTQTGKRYKRQVRIQKGLRNRMAELNIQSAFPMASFLLESLCWCAPNGCFGYPTLFGDFEAVLAWAYGQTETERGASLLREANGIKPLFGPQNPWTRQQVRNYLDDAWAITH